MKKIKGYSICSACQNFNKEHEIICWACGNERLKPIESFSEEDEGVDEDG